ncbi:hypothetical protein IL306_009715 [Fusarium sp. DS 682]|nr:hypothetical protein IL306_009715 [Fusarium sp. DS 682]
MSQSLAKTFNDAKGVEHPQVVFYNAGVGNESSWWGQLTGGAIGAGLDEDVCEVYNFLATNYEPGDELFFFGFSRGAFTARAAAGLVCRVGLCETYMLWRFWEMYAVYKTLGPNERIGDTDWVKSPDSGSEDYFSLDVRGEIVRIKKGSGSEWFTSRFAKKVKVKVVGVWDTVGAIGIPSNIIWDVNNANRKYGFHDTRLNVKDVWESHIENAFHALALDEHRASHPPTLWRLSDKSDGNLVQCWFPGVHINVGGGNNDGIRNKLSDREQLANITFGWMVDRCVPFLKFDMSSLLQIYTLYFNAIVEQRQKFPEGEPPAGWSLGPVVDSLRGLYRTAGSIIRTPGAYFLGDPAERLQWITNECIHPVVWFANQNHNYPFYGLQGFERIPGGGGGHYFTKTYTPEELLYWTDKLKATILSPYRYFFQDNQNEPLKIRVNLPEFVIPRLLDIGYTGNDNEPSERGLITFSYRARAYVANRSQNTTQYNVDAADAGAEAFLAGLDEANGQLLERPWLEVARNEFPNPLEYINHVQ